MAAAAAVAGNKRALPLVEPIAARTRGQRLKALEDNASTGLASLHDVPFKAVTSFLGRDVFATLCAASATTRNKVCTMVAGSYLADRALSPIITQYVREKGLTTPKAAAAWEIANNNARASIAAPHVMGLFQRIVGQSDPFLVTAGSYEKALGPIMQSQFVELADRGMPLDKEAPVPSHRNPLDVRTMGLRMQILDSVAQDQVFQRYAQLFPHEENIDRVSATLGLHTLREAFNTQITAAVLANRPLWVQEYGPLLGPLFASFLTDPERAKTFYEFLREQAEALTDPEKKQALLTFVHIFEQQAKSSSDASYLRQQFVKAVENGTLTPVVVKNFCQEYVTTNPALPFLADLTEESVIPGLPLRARYPEAEPFLLAIVTRKTAFNANTTRDWLDSPQIQALLQKRDQALICEQIMFALFGTISLTLFEAGEAMKVFEKALKKTSLSEDDFVKMVARLQEILSSRLDFINKLFTSSAHNAKLQAARDALGSAANVADFDTSKARVGQIARIAKAMNTYIEAVRASLPNPNDGQGAAIHTFNLEGAPFDVQLQAMQEWLAKPAVVQACQQLVSLDFSRLGLSSFPEGLLRGFPRLVELDLSQNPLREIPPDVEALPRLQSLTLATTLVSVIPAFVWQLPELEELTITSSHIRHLPQEDSAFYTAETVAPLTRLNLGSNSITRIPPGFLSRLPDLTECLFDGNDLRGLPRDFARNWPEGSILSLSGNVHLRASNIHRSVWGSRNPVVLEATKELKTWEKERAYAPKTSFAELYRAVLFRRPRDELRALFAKLSSHLQSVVGLAIWNYWHLQRLDVLVEGTLSPEVQAVHDSHETLEVKEKKEHGVEHLFDERNALLEALEHIAMQLYGKLTPAEQAPLADQRREIANTFRGNSSAASFTPFIDGVVAAHGDLFDAVLFRDIEVLADMDDDWNNDFFALIGDAIGDDE